MGLLKELWDMIAVVDSTMVAWRTTPWRDINVEDMELECKRFNKDIRALDKEVRGRDEEVEEVQRGEEVRGRESEILHWPQSKRKNPL